MNWKTIGFQSLARWLTSSKNISVALKNNMEYVDGYNKPVSQHISEILMNIEFNMKNT